jgi:hypothetical protein
MTYKVGDKIRVWWNTFDKDDNGNNLAFILEIRDYTGPLKYIKEILKLTAPGTKRGWIEMTVTK